MLTIDWIFVTALILDFVIALYVTYLLFFNNNFTDIALYAGASSLILGMHHLMETIQDVELIEQFSEVLEVFSISILLITILKVRALKESDN